MHEQWLEVLTLAEQYGFIVKVLPGVALLATREVQGQGLTKRTIDTATEDEINKALGGDCGT